MIIAYSDLDPRIRDTEGLETIIFMIKDIKHNKFNSDSWKKFQVYNYRVINDGQNVGAISNYYLKCSKILSQTFYLPFTAVQKIIVLSNMATMFYYKRGVNRHPY